MYRFEVLEPEGVFALAETGHAFLTGRLYRLLLPRIDGHTPTDELVSELGGAADPAHLYYALTLLEQRGYIVEADPTTPAAEATFWRSVGADPAAVRARLARLRVAVRTVGEAPAAACVAALEAAGIRVAETGDLDVVLTDDYRREGLAELNRAALAAGRPWLLCKPVGLIAWLGPLFTPGEGPCWACLDDRLRAHRPVEVFLQRKHATPEPTAPARAALSPSVSAICHLIALGVVRWLGLGGAADLHGAVVTLNPWTLEQERHVLVRRPQCPACGDAHYGEHHPPAPIRLDTAGPAAQSDAGTRIATPGQTLERFGHHVSPVTGIVPSLFRTESGSELVHNYFSGLNYAFMHDDLFFLRQHVRGANGGKGTNDLQAKVSALGEAIERYSSIFQGYETRREASYAEMAATAVVPTQLLQYSDAQYHGREAWNRTCAGKHRIPIPLADDRRVDWTPVWSLTEERFVHVPTAFLYFGYPQDWDAAFCFSDSNGTAGGNSREEAILQGLMELVERDAVACWWYNGARRPALDLASFHEPYVDRLVEHYAAIRRDLWVLDITTDLGVPAFAAVSRRNDKAVEDIAVGFAAHPDPRIALLRTLTEVNQLLPSLITINADGSGEYGFPDQATIRWFRTATLANQSYLAPAPQSKPRTCGSFPAPPAGDLREIILEWAQRLRARGLQMLVHDLTRPDLGFPVVKVIVPGLRHFWPRYAPGRLYTVPVELGWQAAPTREEDLNPVAVFI